MNSGPESTNPVAFSADDPETIYLLTSLTAGSSSIITATSRLEHLLKSNKVPFKAVDLATDDRAKSLWGRRGGGKRLPGLVKDGLVLGNYDDVEEWNEYGELKQNLGIKPKKKKKKDKKATTEAATVEGEVSKRSMDLSGTTSSSVAMTSATPNMVPEETAAIGMQTAALAAAAAAAGRNLKKTGSIKSLASVRSGKGDEKASTTVLEEMSEGKDEKATEEAGKGEEETAPEETKAAIPEETKEEEVEASAPATVDVVPENAEEQEVEVEVEKAEEQVAEQVDEKILVATPEMVQGQKLDEEVPEPATIEREEMPELELVAPAADLVVPEPKNEEAEAEKVEEKSAPEATPSDTPAATPDDLEDSKEEGEPAIATAVVLEKVKEGKIEEVEVVEKKEEEVEVEEEKTFEVQEEEEKIEAPTANVTLLALENVEEQSVEEKKVVEEKTEEEGAEEGKAEDDKIEEKEETVTPVAVPEIVEDEKIHIEGKDVEEAEKADENLVEKAVEQDEKVEQIDKVEEKAKEQANEEEGEEKMSAKEQVEVKTVKHAASVPILQIEKAEENDVDNEKERQVKFEEAKKKLEANKVDEANMDKVVEKVEDTEDGEKATPPDAPR